MEKIGLSDVISSRRRREVLDRINESIRDKGLVETTRKVLASQGVTVSCRSLPEQTKRVLATEPTVWFSTHPFEAEPLAGIVYLPTRPKEEQCFVGNKLLVSIFPALETVIFPVSIDHNLKARWGKVRTKIANRMFKQPNVGVLEAGRLARNSIDLAAQKLAKNSLVGIFPMPRDHRKGSPWHGGIGYLVKRGLELLDGREAYGVMSHVEGNFFPADYLRFIFPRLAQRLSRLSVKFSEPFELGSIAEQSPREISASLQKKYEDWLKFL